MKVNQPISSTAELHVHCEIQQLAARNHCTVAILQAELQTFQVERLLYVVSAANPVCHSLGSHQTDPVSRISKELKRYCSSHSGYSVAVVWLMLISSLRANLGAHYQALSCRDVSVAPPSFLPVDSLNNYTKRLQNLATIEEDLDSCSSSTRLSWLCCVVFENCISGIHNCCRRTAKPNTSNVRPVVASLLGGQSPSPSPLACRCSESDLSDLASVELFVHQRFVAGPCFTPESQAVVAWRIVFKIFFGVFEKASEGRLHVSSVSLEKILPLIRFFFAGFRLASE